MEAQEDSGESDGADAYESSEDDSDDEDLTRITVPSKKAAVPTKSTNAVDTTAAAAGLSRLKKHAEPQVIQKQNMEL